MLLFRAALPEVVRKVLVAKGSDAIEGRLEVGDVDLYLLWEAAAVQDVAIVSPDGERLVAWKQLYLRVHLLDLLWHTLRFHAVRLSVPDLNVERLPNGKLNLASLLKRTPSAPAEDVAANSGAQRPPGWTWAVDRLVVEDGRLDFRDEAVPGADPVDIRVRKLNAADLASRRWVYQKPGRVAVDAQVLTAPVEVDAQVAMDPVIRVDGKLFIRDLPIGHVRPYIPQQEWTGLQGMLDATLTYAVESGRREEVHGNVTLRDLGIDVSDLERAALAWKSLEVKIGGIDLLGRRAAIEEVDLRHPAVVVMPRSKPLIPLLKGAAAAASPRRKEAAASVAKRASTSSAPADGVVGVESKAAPHELAGKEAPPSSKLSAQESAKAPGEASPSPVAEAGPTWGWSVERVGVESGHLLVLGTEEPLDLGLRVTAHKIHPGAAIWPLEVQVDDQSASLTATGSARLEPIGFGGTVRWKDLQLPRLLAASGMAVPVDVHSGRLTGKLDVAAGMKTAERTARVGDLEIGGTVEIADLGLSKGEEDQFALGWHRLGIDITSLQLPEVTGGAKHEAETEPIRVRLAKVDLERPDLRLTRIASGLVLPTATSTAEAGAQTTQGTGEAAQAPARAHAAEESAAGAAPGVPAPRVEPGFEAEVGSLELKDGKLAFVDDTPKPPVRQRFSHIHLTARDIAWPARRFDELSLEMNGPGKSKLSVKGHAKPAATVIDLVFKQFGLKPEDPYAEKYTGYAITGGDASLKTQVELGKTDYSSTNHLVLHDLGVSTRSGGSLFTDEFGIPLELALALMTDVKGNISIDVPVSGNREGTRLDLTDTVLSALRHALFNALTSPLKLIGGLAFQGDEIEALNVRPVTFRPGRDEPEEDGLKQVGRLATLLEERPAVTVQLEGTVGKADIRDLQERALLASLKNGGGAEQAEGTVGSSATLQKVRTYLEASLGGKKVALDPAIEPTLDDLLSRQKIPPKRLRDLAAARAATVENLLVQKHGIDSARVEVATPSARIDERGPAVQVDIGASS